MLAYSFFSAVTNDKTDFLGKIISFLNKNSLKYCVIGGLGVNAYVEPVVSLDLDIVVIMPDAEKLKNELSKHFKLKEFPHSINLEIEGSDLRVQIQTDPRYLEFVPRAKETDVMGLKMPVALPGDLLMGKTWAYMDKERRPSKRQKDLADISRLLEKFPEMKKLVPKEILQRME